MSDDGPFGATASTGAASDNPYQFAGRELDPNGGFGIYYFRARYYDSLELNRFLQRDPQGLSGGNYAALYAYVGNSSLNGTDPTGEFAGLFPGGFGNMSDAWTGLPGFAALTGFGGGSPDGMSVMTAELDAVSNGSGDVLAGDYGYVDLNVTLGFGPEFYYLGVTGGVQFTNSGYYPYVGGGFMYPAGPGTSMTIGGSVTQGWQGGLQGALGGIAGQGGYALGSGWFGELGVGTFGASLTGYYVGGELNY